MEPLPNFFQEEVPSTVIFYCFPPYVLIYFELVIFVSIFLCELLFFVICNSGRWQLIKLAQ